MNTTGLTGGLGLVSWLVGSVGWVGWVKLWVKQVPSLDGTCCYRLEPGVAVFLTATMSHGDQKKSNHHK